MPTFEWWVYRSTFSTIRTNLMWWMCIWHDSLHPFECWKLLRDYHFRAMHWKSHTIFLLTMKAEHRRYIHSHTRLGQLWLIYDDIERHEMIKIVCCECAPLFHVLIAACSSEWVSARARVLCRKEKKNKEKNSQINKQTSTTTIDTQNNAMCNTKYNQQAAIANNIWFCDLRRHRRLREWHTHTLTLTELICAVLHNSRSQMEWQ